MPLVKTVRLHPKQSEFRRSQALYRGFVGGRGSGKSWVGAYDLIRRGRRGRTYLIASPTSVIMQDTTFPTIAKIAQELGVWATPKLTPYPSVTLTTGASLRFRTAEDPEKMRGPNLSGVWLDEASLMPRTAYDLCIPALREEGEQGWLSATFTPKGPTHWTYEVFNTGKPDTAIFKAATGENPFNPVGFEDTIRRQYGETQFARQELSGDFVQIEGAEFPSEWFDWKDEHTGESFWFDSWPADLVCKVVYLDPSKGRDAKTADFQAYVMAAINGKGTIYLDAEMNHEPVGDMIARGIRICRDWGPVYAMRIEDNGTMGFIEPEVRRQMEASKTLAPWQTITNREPKLFRIRGLGGYLSRRQIRIRNTKGGRLLRAQLGDIPFAEHDDGPDAAAGAVKILEEIYNKR